MASVTTHRVSKSVTGEMVVPTRVGEGTTGLLTVRIADSLIPDYRCQAFFRCPRERTCRLPPRRMCDLHQHAPDSVPTQMIADTDELRGRDLWVLVRVDGLMRMAVMTMLRPCRVGHTRVRRLFPMG
jgi:hypothetical protein